MKIIDAFIFYNEIDILTYRLALLADVVDYFVIIEATRTFTGKPKELHFDISKFQKYAAKIIHVVTDDLLSTEQLKSSGKTAWDNESTQRNAIDIGISRLLLSPDDIILISDVDEVINPAILNANLLKKVSISSDRTYSLKQVFFYYNLHTVNHEPWVLPKMLTYGLYQTVCENKPQKVRENNTNSWIENAGWHLSYFGDTQFIQNKLNAFSHQEFNNSNYNTEDKISQRVSSGIDLFGRGYVRFKTLTEDSELLPPMYKEYLSKFL